MLENKIALSIDEAAEAAPKGRTAIYDAINDGRLKARKDGRRTLIMVDDYIDYLRSLPEMKSAEQPEDEAA